MTDKSLDVLTQLRIVKAHLPDHRVDVSALVVAELDLTSLVFRNNLAHIGRDRASTRAWHQSTRAEHSTERADKTHHVRSGDTNVEVGPTVSDLLGEIFAANFIRTGLLSRCSRIALGEHDYTLGLSDPVRQHNAAADDLVSLVRVNTEPHVDFDRLVKLGRVELLQHRDRIAQWQWRLGLLFDISAISLRFFGQLIFLVVLGGHRVTSQRSTVQPGLHSEAVLPVSELSHGQTNCAIDSIESIGSQRLTESPLGVNAKLVMDGVFFVLCDYRQAAADH